MMILVVLLGCSKLPENFGKECTGDSDCGAETVCAPVVREDEEVGDLSVCTVPCEGDADCPKVHCGAGTGGWCMDNGFCDVMCQ